MKKVVLFSGLSIFLFLSISAVFAYSYNPYNLDISSSIERLAVWILNLLLGIDYETGCPPESCENLLARVQSKYGKNCGELGYDAVADIDKNKRIDTFDIGNVSSHCGNGEWCQERFRDTFNPCAVTIISTSSSTTTLPCESVYCQELFEMASEKYGSSCGDSVYNKIADVNNDGKIDTNDIVSVSTHCGDWDWCMDRLNDLTNPCISTTSTTTVTTTTSTTTRQQEETTSSTTTSTTTTSTTLPCESVYCQELFEMASEKYGSSCGDGNYDKRLDVNNDGNIDTYDIVDIGAHCNDWDWCMDRLNDPIDPCLPSVSTTTTIGVTTRPAEPTTSTIPCPPESCNDLFTKASEKYGKECGDVGYDAVADIDKDGKIDTYDVVKITSYCGDGESCEKLTDTYDPCPYITTSSSSTTTLPCPPQACQDLLDRTKRNYGKKCGDSDYDPVADVNKDREGDIRDNVEVSSLCGDGESCEKLLKDSSSPCLSATELTADCMKSCSRRYPTFWCRITCGISCGLGLC